MADKKKQGRGKDEEIQFIVVVKMHKEKRYEQCLDRSNCKRDNNIQKSKFNIRHSNCDYCHH